MPVQGSLEKYRVSHKGKVSLKDHPTDDKSLFGHGEKDDHEPYLDQLTTELKELQNALYAEGKHRILVVIQAMDTGGKDGTGKSVFSRSTRKGFT